MRDALHSLIVDKPYDEIAVKEILDRANVGRSTFYAHFHSKDELLASSVEHIIQTVRTASVPLSVLWYERILWFSLPIFDYHERHRGSGRRSMPESAKDALHQNLRIALVGVITDVVRLECDRARIRYSTAPLELIIEMIVSTFILVFNWWLDQADRSSAADANALFRSLVLPVLAQP